ncbi:hypothetical protein ACWJJH_19110 [Endozoicomonadaceae bacterium StTr2]
MNKILYIAANDGTDMRVRKELKSYSKKYSVTFLGLNLSENTNQILSDSKITTRSVNGKWFSISGIIKLIHKTKLELKNTEYKYIHIVDEQLLFFLIAFLPRKKVILDIFDSYMLKLNKPNEKLMFMKHFLYSKLFKILVTDNRRQSLLPKHYISNSLVIENYPDIRTYSYPNKSKKKNLTLAFVGTLTMSRGGKIIEQLLESIDNLEIICAGWIHGDLSTLTKHPRVSYLGVLSQADVHKILCSQADMLFSYYEPSNINNIYASPNKIYDALHANIPILINSHAYVSKIVLENSWGIVYDDENDLFKKILKFDFKSFNVNFDSFEYSWASQEKKLLNDI